jgi:hypothetical protein
MCELHGNHVGHSFSHRKPASLGGSYAPWNGLRACGDGTTLGHGWIEANPLAAEALGWRVPGYADPLLIPAFIWPDPFGPSWAFLTVDGGYDHENALDAALALGFPEVPDYRRTA